MILKKSKLKTHQNLQITGSKSISNRLLILQKLFGNIKIVNLSNAQDTMLIQRALESTEQIIDIHHAGTAMRFLTSYFAIQEGREVILTGSDRMKQRPIGALVDALWSLGADIEYLDNEGYPPLKIVGKNLGKPRVKISAQISSQFITSLMLIAAKLKDGLEIELEGEITSRPYIKMTLKILSNIGIESSFEGNIIKIYPFYQKDRHQPMLVKYEIESDWSSASYFYSFVAIGRESNICLRSYKTLSSQGDSVLKEIYWDKFGVNTITDEKENTITLIPDNSYSLPKFIRLNLNHSPDIAQTICVTAAALKIPFYIDGLATLKVKETDRLVALHHELKKIGCLTTITEDSIEVDEFAQADESISIKTYHDHRMAMSFAPYCLIDSLTIEDEEVVEKSYPDFWKDLEQILEH